MSKLSPQTKLLFFALFTAIAGIFSIATTYFLWADLKGGNTTATVVHVYFQTAYTITFVTKDGTHCQTDSKWNPRPEPVNVSDTFEIHYSKQSPCDNVRRADDHAYWQLYVAGPVFMLIGLTGLAVTKHQAKVGTKACSRPIAPPNR
jgi:hypothetical protein